MKEFVCRRCGETIELARESAGRLSWYCGSCKSAKEHERMLARCEVEKARCRELRNPTCIRCEAPLTFNDSGGQMDTRTVCNACQYKTKQATDAQYRLKKSHVPTGTRAEIMKAAAERRAQPITQELLKRLFLYDPDSGAFIRLNTGKPTGQKNKRGYIVIKVFKRQRQAHQLAWIYSYGEIAAGLTVDHKDRSPSNNRLSNLRLATNTQNQMNKGVSSGNALRIKCVFRYRNGYRTKIKINGKQIGDYGSPLEAWRAYAAAARQHFGQFACLQAEDDVSRLSDAEMQRRANAKPFKQRRLRDRCLLAA